MTLKTVEWETIQGPCRTFFRESKQGGRMIAEVKFCFSRDHELALAAPRMLEALRRIRNTTSLAQAQRLAREGAKGLRKREKP